MKTLWGLLLIVIGAVIMVAAVVLAPLSIFAMAWTQAGQDIYFGLVGMCIFICLVFFFIGLGLFKIGRRVF
jgi:hypothetical protein